MTENGSGKIYRDVIVSIMDQEHAWLHRSIMTCGTLLGAELVLPPL
jgi:hypothetical protein